MSSSDGTVGCRVSGIGQTKMTSFHPHSLLHTYMYIGVLFAISIPQTLMDHNYSPDHLIDHACANSLP